MKAENAKKINPIVDRLAEEIDAFLEGSSASTIKELVAEISKAVPGFSVDLSMELRVFNEQTETSLRLLTTGLSTSDGEEPYVCHGDSSMARYIVDGEICEVPHDHCPNCWASWDFKLKHRTCSFCELSLGKEIKLLLDTDICPNCEEGNVTLKSPRCSKCEFVADETIVAWG